MSAKHQSGSGIDPTVPAVGCTHSTSLADDNRNRPASSESSSRPQPTETPARICHRFRRLDETRLVHVDRQTGDLRPLRYFLDPARAQNPRSLRIRPRGASAQHWPRCHSIPSPGECCGALRTHGRSSSWKFPKPSTKPSRAKERPGAPSWDCGNVTSIQRTILSRLLLDEARRSATR